MQEPTPEPAPEQVVEPLSPEVASLVDALVAEGSPRPAAIGTALDYFMLRELAASVDQAPMLGRRRPRFDEAEQHDLEAALQDCGLGENTVAVMVATHVYIWEMFTALAMVGSSPIGRRLLKRAGG